MVNMETTTTTVVGIAVAAVAEAVAMEEDVVDGMPTTPLLMIITASYHSSLL